MVRRKKEIAVVPVLNIRKGEGRELDDHVIVEEPLEIRVRPYDSDLAEGISVAVTMRTPGDDVALALGFLFSENVIEKVGQVLEVTHLEDADGTLQTNVVEVRLAPGIAFNTHHLSRHVFTSSSCGICGKTTIDEITARVEWDPQARGPVPVRILQQLPERLAAAQTLFAQTGGLHGSALFDLQGQLVAACEDVGRHNALDKLVGTLMQQGGIPARDRILMLSGRIGFELVQKAVCAGIPIIAAIGAPTSLAIELANRFGTTLIGFLKGERFNIYVGDQRVEL